MEGKEGEGGVVIVVTVTIQYVYNSISSDMCVFLGCGSGGSTAALSPPPP